MSWFSLGARDLTVLAVCNTPFLTQTHLISPYKHLCDGSLHLMYNVGKLNALDCGQIMLAMERGGHIGHPKVRMIACQSIEFSACCEGTEDDRKDGTDEKVPTASSGWNSDGSCGILMVDGNVYPQTAVRLTALPPTETNVARLICSSDRGASSRKKNPVCK